MNFASRETHESKSHPGVSFTVRRLNQFQRAKRDLLMVEHSAKFSRLLAQARDLEKGNQKDEKGRTIQTTPEYDSVDHEIGLVLNLELKPAIIRAGLVGVSGLDIDGAPATVESAIADGPEDLLDEIWLAAVAASSMSGEQQKNLLSPSDLLGPEVGSESSMIAKPVNGLATSEIETAGASSPRP